MKHSTFILVCCFSLRIAFCAFTGLAQDVDTENNPFLTGPVHQIPESPVDQEHLRLALHFDIDETRVYGDALLRLRPTEYDVSSFTLSSADLDVDSVWVGYSDTTMLYTENWEVESDSLHIRLDSLAFSRPDSTIHRNQAFYVRLVYSAQPKKGLNFLQQGDSYESPQIWTQGGPEDHRHWLPVSVAPDDRFSLETQITVDAPLRALCIGSLVSETVNENGTVTYQYQQQQPVTTLLIQLAVGAFEVTREDITLSNGDDVSLEYLLGPAQRDLVSDTFGQTAEILRYFSDRLSFSYVDEQYAQIVVNNFHHDELETAGIAIFPPEVIINRTEDTETGSVDRISRILARHWFGYIVSPEYWTDTWLSEGFSQYLSALFKEQTKGQDEYHLLMQEIAGSYLHESTKYQRPMVWDQWEDTAQMFDAHSRDKGAWVLHMLRQKTGEDTFWRTLEIYIKRHAFESVLTPAFRETLEAITGDSFVDFFDQWVYSAGHPILDVTYSYGAREEEITLQIEQEQSGYLVPDVFVLNLNVEVYTLAGPVSFDIQLNERQQTFILPLDMPPRFVTIDPDHSILMAIGLDQPATAWAAQLRYSESVLNRFRAIRSLIDFADDTDILLGLRSAFAQESSEKIRTEIIKTISVMIPSPSTQRVLIDAYGDPSSLVRAAVIEALANYAESPEVPSFVLNAAETDQSPLVQAAAVVSLARMGTPSASNIARSALITPSYRDIVRRAGFDALSLLEIPDRERIEHGTEYSGRSYSEEVRITAIGHLAPFASSNSRVRNLLISYLDEQNDRVREAAIRALSGTTHRTARRALQRCLDREIRPHLLDLLKRALSTAQQD